MNDMDKQLQVAKLLLTGLFEHQNPLCVILSGPPGFGKSHLVRKLCTRHKVKWAPIRPSAKDLVHHLSEHGTLKQPIIFDDFDDVFDDRKRLEIFKVAVDSHDERVLSNNVRGPERVETFRVTSPVIFLTNRNLREPGHFNRRVWQTDIPALRDRASIVQLPFDRRTLDEYTLGVAPGLLSGVKMRDRRGYDCFLSREQQVEILDHFRVNSTRYYEQSPRVIYKLAKLRLSYPADDDWNKVRETHLQPVGQAKPGAVQLAKQPCTSLSQRMNDGRWHGNGSNWSTPQDRFDEWHVEFHFTLDVCAEAWNAKCIFYFTPELDGLQQDWGTNVCWMNPPYGCEIERWMKKAYESSLRGATVVCLVPPRTNSKWWHQYVEGKAEIRTIEGRVWFTTESGERKQCFMDSLLVIFRPQSLA